MSSVDGAAARFSVREYGGTFATRENTVTVNNETVPILRSDPNRIGWLIVNTGSSSIALGFSAPVNAGSGLLLNGNGSQANSNVRDDGNVAAFPVWGLGDAAGGSVYTVEFYEDYRYVERGE